MREKEKIDVFCIGTPNVIGDALGPLVGSMLSRNDNLDINIVGTIEDPVVQDNYTQQLERLRQDATVIVVDAIIGEDVGTYTIQEGSIKPGDALSTGIAPIGDIAVKCVTGTTVMKMMNANPWHISIMAYAIATELMDMLQSSKNKYIYRDKKIYI